MRFSLFFFSASDAGGAAEGYRLLLACARYADEHGFAAVWTPERHFHDFGGLYPNPSVLGSALAVSTVRIRIRAGSVVAPLHHPVRIAEEWAVVDNLSGGRVDVAFASGWHPEDFVIAPDAYADRRRRTLDAVGVVRELWRGGAVRLRDPRGEDIAVSIRPRPVQRMLPIWLTATSRPETFVAAGSAGCNVLTALVGQPMERLRDNVRRYRESYQPRGGHESERGQVTLMLHAFVGDDDAEVRRLVREPLRVYVQGYMAQHDGFANRLASATERQRTALSEMAFQHYYRRDSLLGTAEKCLRMVEQAEAAGVDEIACLIDFGVPSDAVLAGLDRLDDVRLRAE